ncbi:MAG: hypothetical protein AMXMBFR13_16380 [Phycisphaerae bacterium]
MNRWLAGEVFWPLTERLLGRDTMRRFHSLARSDDWPHDLLRELQRSKLKRLLGLAHEHAPYHAARLDAAGVDVHDPALGLSELVCLPVVDREDIRTHLEEMTWRGCPGGARPYATGGSSGEPLKFFTDRGRQAADWAARWRARGWWDVRPGDVEVLLWGAPIELEAQERLRIWRDGLLNQHLLNAFDMSPSRMDDYIEFIHARRPACLYGYASSLALLARYARERGLEAGGLGWSWLKAVFTTGEVLMDADRDAIDWAFGVPVVNEYGCRDGGLLGLQCPAGRLHVPEENVIVELLTRDGHPVGPGETGEVVLTSLEAVATFMIRYRTGDLAVAAKGPCPCGRSSMTLASVQGRVTDQIICRENGELRRMHALSLMYVLREAEGLRQFRITQPSLDEVDVEIVAGLGFTEETERAVRRGLRARLGPHVTVRLSRKDHIPPTGSGKHACVVSQVAEGALR